MSKSKVVISPTPSVWRRQRKNIRNKKHHERTAPYRRRHLQHGCKSLWLPLTSLFLVAFFSRGLGRENSWEPQVGCRNPVHINWSSLETVGASQNTWPVWNFEDDRACQQLNYWTATRRTEWFMQKNMPNPGVCGGSVGETAHIYRCPLHSLLIHVYLLVYTSLFLLQKSLCCYINEMVTK